MRRKQQYFLTPLIPLSSATPAVAQHFKDQLFHQATIIREQRQYSVDLRDLLYSPQPNPIPDIADLEVEAARLSRESPEVLGLKIEFVNSQIAAMFSQVGATHPGDIGEWMKISWTKDTWQELLDRDDKTEFEFGRVPYKDPAAPQQPVKWVGFLEKCSYDGNSGAIELLPSHKFNPADEIDFQGRKDKLVNGTIQPPLHRVLICPSVYMLGTGLLRAKKDVVRVSKNTNIRYDLKTPQRSSLKADSDEPAYDTMTVLVWQPMLDGKKSRYCKLFTRVDMEGCVKNSNSEIKWWPVGSPEFDGVNEQVVKPTREWMWQRLERVLKMANLVEQRRVLGAAHVLCKEASGDLADFLDENDFKPECLGTLRRFWQIWNQVVPDLKTPYEGITSFVGDLIFLVNHRGPSTARPLLFDMLQFSALKVNGYLDAALNQKWSRADPRACKILQSWNLFQPDHVEFLRAGSSVTAPVDLRESIAPVVRSVCRACLLELGLGIFISEQQPEPNQNHSKGAAQHIAGQFCPREGDGSARRELESNGSHLLV